MTVEKFIFATLTAISSATHALAATRVYPVMRKKNSPAPDVTYGRESAEESTDSCGPTGLVAYGFEFDCRATTFDQTIALADAVLTDLRAAKPVNQVTLDATSDLIDSEPGIYVRSITLTIWHTP